MKRLFIHFLIALLVAITITSCDENKKGSVKIDTPASSISKAEMENEVWKMEERYWEYVQKIDTVPYKTLWHDDFVGYPSFGDGVSNKSKIAIWIPELHKDTSLTFSYKLYKKATNAIDDVVIVFYDTDEIWTDKANKVVRQETYKFTHTWRKQDGHWVILGGMGTNKNQDVLSIK
jgi:hypothetical protein